MQGDGNVRYVGSPGMEVRTEHGRWSNRWVLQRYSGHDTSVVIPEEVDSIAEDAFAGNQVQEITMHIKHLGCFDRWDYYSDKKTILMEHVIRLKLYDRGNDGRYLHLGLDRLSAAFPKLQEIVLVLAGERTLELSRYAYPDLPVLLSSTQVTAVVGEVPEDARAIRLCVPNTAPERCAKPHRIALMSAFFDQTLAVRYNDAQRAVYEAWIANHRAAFFTQTVEANRPEFLESYLARSFTRAPFMPATYDRLLAMAEAKNLLPLKAALMYSKAKFYDMERLEAAREKRENAAFEHPDSPQTMRRHWGWSNRKGEGLTLTSCKWEEDDSPWDIPVIVPERIGDDPVFGLADGLFKKTNAREFMIPDTICECGGSVFRDNKRVVKVEIAAQLELIPPRMFKGCEVLEEVSLPETANVIAAEAFSESGIKRITLPPGIKMIGERAFEHTSRLSSFSGSGLVLQKKAFAHSGVETVSLRGTYVIPEHAFAATMQLKMLDIRDAYVLENYALYSSAVEELHLSYHLYHIGLEALPVRRLKKIYVHGSGKAEDLVNRLRRLYIPAERIIRLEDRET